MPVAYNSAPPAFQIDPQSVQNFNRACHGQGFNGVFNVQTGMVYFHPYAPSIEQVEFQRDGAVTSCAVPLGPSGGGHAWVMFMSPRVPSIGSTIMRHFASASRAPKGKIIFPVSKPSAIKTTGSLPAKISAKYSTISFSPTRKFRGLR